jgi:hypothetical protein
MDSSMECEGPSRRAALMRNSPARPTASSYAARRLRHFPFIVWEEDWPGTIAFSPASRVSISELIT